MASGISFLWKMGISASTVVFGIRLRFQTAFYLHCNLVHTCLERVAGPPETLHFAENCSVTSKEKFGGPVFPPDPANRETTYGRGRRCRREKFVSITILAEQKTRIGASGSSLSRQKRSTNKYIRCFVTCRRNSLKGGTKWLGHNKIRLFITVTIRLSVCYQYSPTVRRNGRGGSIVQKLLLKFGSML